MRPFCIDFRTLWFSFDVSLKGGWMSPWENQSAELFTAWQKKKHISENLNSELNNFIRGHLCAYWYHLYSLRDDSKLLFFGPSTPSNSSFVHTTNKHKKGDELGRRPYENTTNTKVYSKCIERTVCSNNNINITLR